MPRPPKPGVMPIEELRRQWSEVWGITPHTRIGRTMLEKSLTFKRRELAGLGMTPAQRARLNQLIKAYKRNPNCFDDNRPEVKAGTRLIKEHAGSRHVVTILQAGYEYQDKTYNSLSQIASEISGTRWNGWAFFGLRRKRASA